MSKSLVLWSLPVLILSGCGDSTSIVKDKVFTYQSNNGEVYTYDDSLTIEQAFDNRAVCSSFKWHNFEDSRGREVIEYNCVFDGFSDFITGWMEKRQAEELRLAEQKYPADIPDRNEKTGYFITEKYKGDIPESATETYQWRLNADGEPKYSYNGIEILFLSGNSLNCSYPLHQSLKRIYNDAPLSNYADLIRSVRYIVGTQNGFNGAKNYDDADFYSIEQKIALDMMKWDSKRILGKFSDKRIQCRWN